MCVSMISLLQRRRELAAVILFLMIGKWIDNWHRAIPMECSLRLREYRYLTCKNYSCSTLQLPQARYQFISHSTHLYGFGRIRLLKKVKNFFNIYFSVRKRKKTVDRQLKNGRFLKRVFRWVIVACNRVVRVRL